MGADLKSMNKRGRNYAAESGHKSVLNEKSKLTERLSMDINPTERL